MPYAKAKLSDYARKLPAYKLFDLMSATRGPDIYNSSLLNSVKSSVVARLRSIAFGEKPQNTVTGTLWESSTISQNVLQFLDSKRREEIDLIRKKPFYNPYDYDGHTHFIYHVRDAIKATRDHPIWANLSHELITLLDDIEKVYYK